MIPTDPDICLAVQQVMQLPCPDPRILCALQADMPQDEFILFMARLRLLASPVIGLPADAGIQAAPRYWEAYFFLLVADRLVPGVMEADQT